MHNSLPVGDVLGRRISNTSRPCALCGDHAETVCHALFKCPWARTLWMASSVGLRTEDLTDNVSNLLAAIFENSEENKCRLIANHIWALWKLRCTEVYEGKKATPQKFMALAASYDRLETVAGLTKGVIGDNTQQRVHEGAVTCIIDGSFSMPNTGGWAYIFTDEDGSMMEYGLQDGMVSSPLHAEIMAMQLALLSACKRGIKDCVFYTDCVSLSMVINNSLQPDQLDWRVYQELLNVIYYFKRNSGFVCAHISRDQIALVDELARFARKDRIASVGFTFPFFKPTFL
ncbi:hypothetical protein LUZ61_020369 [Rhynchospora tenuis]|uniref:RNase H type-1 domain-containing protein n=1 Tax=Rhynchospora tenuis TaxID=198213 RepID=A0AAD5ZD67_9POAL|nr:hypothetical protein LUZ61_020369 [Rhynchospora tenuis]